MSNYSFLTIRTDNVTFFQFCINFINIWLMPILSVSEVRVIGTAIWSCLPRIKDRDTYD